MNAFDPLASFCTGPQSGTESEVVVGGIPPAGGCQDSATRSFIKKKNESDFVEQPDSDKINLN